MVELAVTNSDGRPINPLRVLRGRTPSPTQSFQ